MRFLVFGALIVLTECQINVDQALNQNKLNFDAAVPAASGFSDEELSKVSALYRTHLIFASFQTFPRTNVSRMRSALSALRQNWSVKLQQMPARNYQATGGAQEVMEQQKPLREKPRDRVKVEGDTLHQVNKAAGLNDVLYQGDMVLTE